jgi:integrase
MLILSGQRRSEVANACRSEIKLDKQQWEIPIQRMKAKSAHVVPLTDEMLALLQSLPEFTKGDFIFSTTFGVKAINGFAKAKVRVDALMRKELGRKIAPWVLHDIRRTMRTHLSAIPGISDLVRELVIGHTKPGLHKVYDQHAYLDEKRHALELWGARLRSIINPPPANVVALKASA